jgi:glucose/arabinose dehydrogenase
VSGTNAGARVTTARLLTAVAVVVAAALIVVLVVLAGDESDPDAGAGPVNPKPGKLNLVEIEKGFENPVHVASAPGYPDLLFVVEVGGTIQVVEDGERKPEPFLDISDQVQAGGEQGLLSIAFHPEFESNHLFYVYYTTKGGNNRIAELEASTPTDADEGSQSTVITFQHPRFENHNGGQLQFGPDGNLWVGTGDGGGTGDELDNARDLDSLLGKLLRIDPVADGSGEYEIPDDNPYVGRAGRDEIYAYGLRNPFRFSFERGGDRIAIGDVGQFEVEEIDYESIEGARGVNFGWPEFEGEKRYSNRAGSDPPHEPIETYAHRDENLDSVTGGYVVTDPNLPSLAGRYVYADFYEGRIRSLVPEISGARDVRSHHLEVASPSSFGEGPNGEIYVTSFSEGRLLQFVEG